MSTKIRNSRKYKVNVIKIVIIGIYNVGKTTLLMRYINRDENEENNYPTTIGVEFERKRLLYKETRYDLEIFDTAGLERFQPATMSYVKRNDFIIFVFDNTEKSLEYILNNYKNELNSSKQETVFVLTKFDLLNSREEKDSLIKNIQKKLKDNLHEIPKLYVIDNTPKSINIINTIFMNITKNHHKSIELNNKSKENEEIETIKLSIENFKKNGISSVEEEKCCLF